MSIFSSKDKSVNATDSNSKLKATAPTVVRDRKEYLLAFLHGTIQEKSPLSKLRGHDSVLRIIWGIVCEEWIHLHIDRFPIHNTIVKIPELLPWENITNEDVYGKLYPESHRSSAGCPVAVIEKDIPFPALSIVQPNSFQHQDSDALYVNMMPFDLRNAASLPEVCRPYYSLVQKCCRVMSRMGYGDDTIAYLTIDERPTPSGTSQRRGGLHVESPGIMPLIQSGILPSEAKYAIETSHNVFVPGAEHHWGGGLMMRSEHVQGGIFMASNIADTTAVWNCRIDDEDGEFIGAHGDIEHMREALGPCARTLEAGELIWMTDRTPHESLPIPTAAGANARRQYFRLVVGEVSAWFADHSTPNPLGIVPPPKVRIIHGDKFALYPPLRRSRCLYGGTPAQIKKARAFQEVTQRLYEFELGHIAHRMKGYGLTSKLEILRLFRVQGGPHKDPDWSTKHSKDGMALFNDRGSYYHDRPQFEEMIMSWEAELAAYKKPDDPEL